MKTAAHLVIVGLGSVVPQKYAKAIARAKQQGTLASYSVLELSGRAATIEPWLVKMPFAPASVDTIAGPPLRDLLSDSADLDEILNRLRRDHGDVRLLVATEVASHLQYLEYCIAHDIACLVEKPAFITLRNGRFAPSAMAPKLQELLVSARRGRSACSIVSSVRYNDFYWHRIISRIAAQMQRWNAPVTSAHVSLASGVWNTTAEFLDRDDHPYKHNYGMLTHSGYHYLDMLVAILKLNRAICGDDLVLRFSAFGARPADQQHRIPAQVRKRLLDTGAGVSEIAPQVAFGETDLVASFSLNHRQDDRVVTVGTMALEQSSPSVRSWPQLPSNIYNKNGRVTTSKVSATLSTLWGISGVVHKFPEEPKPGQDLTRLVFGKKATVWEQTNASLFPDDQYFVEENWQGTFSEGGEVLESWLAGKDDRCEFASHYETMMVMAALAEAIERPGEPMELDFRPFS